MKYKILVLILALFLITPAVTAEEWWNSEWTYRKHITLSNIENVDRVDDTVIIENIQEVFPLAQEDFGDLRLVENGNEIAYEIFDSNTKLRFVTTILENSEKEIAAYYGNPQIDYPDYSNCAVWQPCTPLWNYTKLMMWYKFEEEEVLDYSGNYGAENAGAEFIEEGKFGNAFEYNGEDYMGSEWNSDSKTISFWFKTTDSVSGIMSQEYDTTETEGDWRAEIMNGKFRLSYYPSPGTAETLDSENNYNDGLWHFVSLIMDSENNDLIVEIDSYPVSSAGGYGVNYKFGNNKALNLGRAGDNQVWNYFNGIIDEVKIWDKTKREYFQEELIQTIEEQEEEYYHTDLQILEEGILFSDDNPLVNTTVTVTAFFENLLEIDPDEVLVRFYQGYPNEDNVIGEDLVNIRGKSTFFAQTEYIPTEDGQQNIYVWVDPENTILENNEDNNIASKILQVKTKPDLRIRNEDIGFSDNHPYPGDEIQIFAMVRNLYNEPAENFTVFFYEAPTHTLIGETVISIEGLQTEVITIPWIAYPIGGHTIYVTVDRYREIDEWDETNNHAEKSITVFDPHPEEPIRFKMH